MLQWWYFASSNLLCNLLWHSQEHDIALCQKTQGISVVTTCSVVKLSWKHAPLIMLIKYIFSTMTLFDINSYSASHNNWCTATLWNRIMTAQCEGDGEVGSARYELIKYIFSTVTLFDINSYSASHNNWCTATLWNRIMTAQCEGMGEVGSAR